MSPNLSDLTEQVSLTPFQALGIPIALIGAVFLSIGAQLQHRGVAKVETRLGASRGGMSVRQVLALIGRPSWVMGTLMLGLAVVFQLTSLRVAPLLVVQPLGAVALVITAVLNARSTGRRLSGRIKRSIAICVGGIGLFATVAAFTAIETEITTDQLITVLVILLVVGAVLAVAFVALRHRRSALFYIIGAGVLYGFVATLAKVVLNRVFAGNFDGLSIVCIVMLLAAAALGGYFVQNAYSSGSPDLVIAGLTVVDPIVAVTIGIVVLGEAANAPGYAVALFLVAGAIAVYGVFQLAKYQPAKRS
ncbi:DMT family transporter [Frigoribacterium sp. CFBP9039]|uniref:DMT family transporter n=1 Tax=unclassified Frigoribacterium TaxID=2627005 RepID=UPI00177EB414|nr:DMT family transporter [Frigoribacterium sp. CFBP9039]MBD8702143.1 DMT family transporter [Frigoribacterium sp. CFBP 13712]MDY0947258.1 DMT family transporter [Frigoribacterium sp. CFBP9039]